MAMARPRLFLSLFLALLLALHAAAFAQVQSAASAPRGAEDEQQAAAVSAAAQLAASGKPEQALAAADRVIAHYREQHRGAPERIYCARGNADTLYYLMKHASDHLPGKAIVVHNWCEALLIKGYALGELKRYAQARVALEAAVEMSPANEQYLSELGSVFLREKDWPKALEIYTRAEEVAGVTEPQSRDRATARALRGQGFALIELNRLDEAQAKYQRSLELERGNTLAQNQLRYIEKLRLTGANVPVAPATSAASSTASASAAGAGGAVATAGATAAMDAFGKLLAALVEQQSGKLLCLPPGTTYGQLRTAIGEELKLRGGGGTVSVRDAQRAAFTRYPCPFSPARAEVRPATTNDVEGVWVFPATSQRLRFGPRSTMPSPTAPRPTVCDAVAWYPGGEAQTVLSSGVAECPFRTASDLERFRIEPPVSGWSLLPGGRLKVTRTGMPDYIEEWDVFVVTEPFTAADTQFAAGDLLAYLRRVKGNEANAATAFRHLKKLR
jgi:tetratricopeptide (TPR) repeat protein